MQLSDYASDSAKSETKPENFQFDCVNSPVVHLSPATPRAALCRLGTPPGTPAGRSRARRRQQNESEGAGANAWPDAIHPPLRELTLRATGTWLTVSSQGCRQPAWSPGVQANDTCGRGSCTHSTARTARTARRRTTHEHPPGKMRMQSKCKALQV